jgi:hypothetical protein
MIRLSVSDTLQNYSNEYVFSTQEDVTAAIHMLFDFAGYSEENLKTGSLSVGIVSDKPLDTGKPFYEF